MDQGSIFQIWDELSGFRISFLEYFPFLCAMVWINFPRKSSLVTLRSLFPCFFQPCFLHLFSRCLDGSSPSFPPLPTQGSASSMFMKFPPQDLQSPAHPVPGAGSWSRDGRSGKRRKGKLEGFRIPVFLPHSCFLPSLEQPNHPCSHGSRRKGKIQVGFSSSKVPVLGSKRCFPRSSRRRRHRDSPGDGSWIHPAGILTLSRRWFLSQLLLRLLLQ